MRHAPLGAKVTIIWMYYGGLGIEMDETTVRMLLVAILSDTGNLQSNATTEAHRMVVSPLSEAAGVDEVDAYYHDLLKESLSHEGMSDEGIFLSDLKKYEAGSTTYAIAVVSVWDEDEAREMAGRMAKAMPARIKPSTLTWHSVRCASFTAA